MVRNGLGIMAFNLLSAICVWLTMYFPGLDIGASLVFISVTYMMNRRLAAQAGNVQAWIGSLILGQLPGLISETLALWSWYHYGPLTSFWDFVLQMWHTQYVPLLSMLPVIKLSGFPVSFLILYLLAPLYIILFTIGNLGRVGKDR